MELEADKGKWPHFPEEMEEILAVRFPGELTEVRQVHSSALLMHALIIYFFMQPKYEVNYEALASISNWN